MVVTRCRSRGQIPSITLCIQPQAWWDKFRIYPCLQCSPCPLTEQRGHEVVAEVVEDAKAEGKEGEEGGDDDETQGGDDKTGRPAARLRQPTHHSVQQWAKK